MPKIDIKPQEIGPYTEKIITARKLPEELFGPDVIYVKHQNKHLKELAYYGLYRKNPKEYSQNYETLWQNSMKEDYDMDWKYTGRFF